MNDMTQIQPKTVWSHTPFNNKKIILSTDFKFVEKDYSYGNSIKLLIKWQNPLLESTTSSLAF
ncbi:hypothetical protein CHA01nite_13660 [Chryseobacterium hagamense]|uniref:Uncharacterized protein n=1 Tax=Chryseobacterium hagamense TaxID=395935 RepID=A0A511YKF0_9FLAO|nr:hypothetical protein CHA01nite_13660 [Chryseobacterium hagamense]